MSAKISKKTSEKTFLFSDGPGWDKALDIATRFGFELQTLERLSEISAAYYLQMREDILSVRSGEQWARDISPISIDFERLFAHRYKQRGLAYGPFEKALGLSKGKKSTVLDGSCGMGQDAVMMLVRGFRVVACEKNALICALLWDGLSRIQTPVYKEIMDERFELRFADCGEILRQGAQSVADIFYFDPMYPQRTKSALPNKQMRLFHQILGADADPVAVLSLAYKSGFSRIVLKRPPRAPSLKIAGDIAPTVSFSGKSVRYDVYVGHDNKPY